MAKPLRPTGNCFSIGLIDSTLRHHASGPSPHFARRLNLPAREDLPGAISPGIIQNLALTCGGLLGGFMGSKHGLKSWLWPMVCIIHLPDAMFIYLAYAQPGSLLLISAAVAVEQFG